MCSILGTGVGGREGAEGRIEEALESILGWNKKGLFDSDRLGTEIPQFWEQICSVMQSMGRTLQNWRESWVWYFFPFFFFNSPGVALRELYDVLKAHNKLCFPGGGGEESSQAAVLCTATWYFRNEQFGWVCGCCQPLKRPFPCPRK